MAGTNTEKPTGKSEAKKTVAPKTPKITKAQVAKAPVAPKDTKTEDKTKPFEKVTAPKGVPSEGGKEKKTPEVKAPKGIPSEEGKEKKPVVAPKGVPPKSEAGGKKVKKTKVFINLENVQASTKYSIAICKFIKNKTIEKAIKDLEQVSVLKKAVPMKGEIPHRKGKIMSGRYPARAAKEFIMALKSLQGNCNQHDLEEPIIGEAFANKGSTVYGRMGRTQKKRTHIKIVAVQKKSIKQKGENKK